MKRFASLGLLPVILGLSALTLASCDSSPGGEDMDIPDGSYTEFGERAVVEDSVVYEGIAGVYVQRIFLFEEDRVTITVLSDLAPEEGTARGHYVAEGQSVRILIETSTTSYYERGDEAHYDEVEVVDGSFQVAFGVDEDTLVFEGPGLVLTEVTTDADDTDEDGNTDETLRINHYLSLSSE